MSYTISRFVTFWIAVTMFGFRCFHRHREPESGGILILSNHSSHLDPVLLGSCLHRHLRFMARDTLFKGAFASLIRALGAYPVTRGKRDEGAFRATTEMLMNNEPVIIFGEGTRSIDGEIQDIKGGIEILARRSNAPILPIVIDGARDVMPKGRSLLRSEVHNIRVIMGEPIWPDEYRQWKNRTMPVQLRERLIGLQAELRAQRAAHGKPGITVLTRDVFPAFLAWLRWFLKLVGWMIRLVKGKKRASAVDPVGAADGTPDRTRDAVDTPSESTAAAPTG